MRRFEFGKKKLRGSPRRLRSLSKWAESYADHFPTITEGELYWNVKIPVTRSLVDGRQTTKALQASCMSSLIKAAFHIYQSVPGDCARMRVTCLISRPDMFGSEICIFGSEDYFKEHTQPGVGIFGALSVITSRSLCSDLSLILPPGFSELGILRIDEDDDGKPCRSEVWYIGDVTDAKGVGAKK